MSTLRELLERFGGYIPVSFMGRGSPRDGLFLRGDGVWGEPSGVAREPSGFPNRTDSAIAVDDTTRTLTISPVGESFSIYSAGDEIVFATEQSQTWTDVDGLHFLYFASGVLTHSTTPWDLADPTIVPVAALLWSVSLADSIVFEERHGLVMDRETHAYLHATRGTQISTGGRITSGTYQVAPVSPANADNSFGIDATTVHDEDIKSVLAALTDGSAIGRLWRTGASGVWVWDTSAVFPKVGAGGSYIAKNVLSGTWQLLDIGSTSYVNWWLIAMPVLTAGYRFALVPGQAEHSSLALAQAEDIYSSIAWGSVPFTEAVGLYRITYRAGASYSSTGKCRIEAVQRIAVGGLAL